MPVERIQRVAGRGLPVRGDNIDTDRIIPARFLKSITFEGLERHLFEDDREAANAHPVSDPRYHGAAILIVNANFGCGSSREHAPQAIRRWGIRAVIGESFSEIFFGNAVALGMPCLTASPDDVRRLQHAIEASPSAGINVDLETMTAVAAEDLVQLSLPPAAREAFVTGTWDATGLLLDRFDEVEAVAARLPYINGWRQLPGD
jgi:3-isopropylmalate/(R)-2-methylmalate dehydratase small subunit